MGWLEDYRTIPDELPRYNMPFVYEGDMNSAVVNAHIPIPNPRIRTYSNIINKLSDKVGLVVISHQGRPSKPDCISLDEHKYQMEEIITKKRIEIVRQPDFYTEATREKIKRLQPGEILLYDNIRLDPDETKPFNLDTSKFVKYFKGIAGGINDRLPAAHRDNDSMVGISYLEPTFIGPRAIYELNVLEYAKSKLHKGGAGIQLGGGKADKSEKYLPHLAGLAEIFLTGVPGMLKCYVEGYSLGPKNDNFLKGKIKPQTIEAFKSLKGKNIHRPIDFVVEDKEKGIIRTVPVEKMCDCEYEVCDIGEETVEMMGTRMKLLPLLIVGGPAGKVDEGKMNFVKLIDKCYGVETIVLGGDSIWSLDKEGLLGPMEAIGSKIMLAGGAFYHGLCDMPYPCFEHLKKLKPDNNRYLI